jgi:hypothetical protein
MTFSVLNLGGFPSTIASGFVDPSAFTFTNGVSTTNAGSFIVGYLDGESRAKMFYTDGSTVSLPTLVSVSQITYVDSAGTTKTGGYVVVLNYSAGSPDSTSANSEIFLDDGGLLLKASTAFG